MGTRSRIGVMHGDKCKSVYCHWDGYLSHNGAILQKHYDSSRANHLVALGNMSTLGKEIGEKHAFSEFEVRAEEVQAYKELTENWTTFYMRDREEKDQEFEVSHSFNEFLELCIECGAEYYYIMRDGEWYCGDMYAHTPSSMSLTLLTEALINEKETV
jgi:hypothetical protein